jgi:amino acid adenylation domain-containing protein
MVMNKNVGTVLPLTPLQQGMLFHSLLAGEPDDHPEYVAQLGVSITGELDVSAFEAAWQEVVRRNAVLRTCFVLGTGREPVQVVLRGVSFRLGVVDWSGVSPVVASRRWEELLRRDRRRGFVLSRAPLLRVVLVRLGPGSFRLVWSFSHLLLDGWSVSLLLGELWDVYAGLVAGSGVVAGVPGRPFADYVGWLRGRDGSVDEGFWRAELAGLEGVSPVRLVGDAGVSGVGFGEVCVELPVGVTAGLGEVARASRLTVNCWVLAGWLLVLAGYSRSSDVVVGVVSAGRPAELSGVESMVGLFVNTVPLRVAVGVGGSVVDWVRLVGEGLWRVQEFGYSSLVDVQRWSGLPAGTGLFDTLYAFENYPVEAAGPDRDGRPRMHDAVFHDTSTYPLNLIAAPVGDRLRLRLLHDRAQINDDAATRIVDQLRETLAAMVAGPDRPVVGLPEVDVATGRELVRWNRTGREFPRESSLPELFAAQVAARPDAVAVADEHGQVSYAGLARRSRWLAGRLWQVGVRPGDPVGVCAGPSGALAAAHLAVLQLGAVCVPLDPEAPAHRTGQILRDAVARVALTAGPADALVGWPGQRVDLAAAAAPEPPARFPGGLAAAGSAAYAIYTSGSTGAPKGVVLPHSAVIRTVVNSDYLRFGTEDVGLMGANPAFDASLWELWGPLLAGARVRAVGRSVLLNPDALAEIVDRDEVTVMFVTTALFNLLATSIPQTLGKLRALLFGGESNNPETVDRLLRTGPPGRLLHMYGPTESATYATWHEVTEVAGAVPIGAPIANTTGYVVDGAGRLAPLRVPGELHLGGDGLAWGYQNQPGHTADAFRPDQWAGRPGARRYRTGDLVARHPDGNLEFLGRIDFQVKIRGHRVEPGEIEAALAAHPAVRACLVVAQDQADQNATRLVAYLVPHDPADAGERLPGRLRSYLSSRLPDYLVPSAFVPLEAFPLNRNGKVDRRALPDPVRTRSGPICDPPADELERRLAAVWQEVLKTGQVGRQEDFFELGGDSLRAVTLTARVRATFGYRMPLSMVVANPTVAAMAEVLRMTTGDRPRSPLIPIQRGTGRRPALFCVHPGGGNVLSYVPLARRLGSRQAVYGLEDASRDTAPDRSIESLAATYLEAVRGAEPRGPYLLAGWSFGGLVAYELAARLRSAGAEVPLVALFDTGAPEVVGGYRDADPALVLAILGGELLERDQDAVPELHRELTTLAPPEQVKLVFDRLQRAGKAPAGAGPDWLEQELAVFQGRAAAAAAYRPAAATGRVHLLRAAATPLAQLSGLPTSVANGLRDPARGWRGHCGDGKLQVVEVPGDHGTMFLEPHVRGLADTLGRLIVETTDHDPK